MWWVSIVPFTIRKAPPPISTTSRQETSKSKIVKIGSVNPMIQVSENSSARRPRRARAKPILRAVCC